MWTPNNSFTGFSRRVFADVDDEEDDDDLFGSNSIFASRANQKLDNDESFFDKPPPTNPSSLFSQHNPQPPPPTVYQTTPPPPTAEKRNISNPTPEKLARTLFPDSPSTDDEGDIFFPPSKIHQPATVAEKENPNKQIPGITHLASNNGDGDGMIQFSIFFICLLKLVCSNLKYYNISVYLLGFFLRVIRGATWFLSEAEGKNCKLVHSITIYIQTQLTRVDGNS